MDLLDFPDQAGSGAVGRTPVMPRMQPAPVAIASGHADPGGIARIVGPVEPRVVRQKARKPLVEPRRDALVPEVGKPHRALQFGVDALMGDDHPGLTLGADQEEVMAIGEAPRREPEGLGAPLRGAEDKARAGVERTEKGGDRRVGQPGKAAGPHREAGVIDEDTRRGLGQADQGRRERPVRTGQGGPGGRQAEAQTSGQTEASLRRRMFPVLPGGPPGKMCGCGSPVFEAPPPPRHVP